MLVSTMNDAEITAEVIRDYEKVESISIQRLLDEYGRDRKKLKIAKERDCTKLYRIKSASKNNWLIFIQKSPGVDRYRKSSDAVAVGVVYFFARNGFKFFRPQKSSYLEVFNGHFFTRYNERMHLNLTNHIDMAERFFANSGYLRTEIINKDGRRYSTGLCREGLALGEYYNHVNWLVHKTFITHDMKHAAQKQKEQRFLLEMQEKLLKKRFGMDHPKEMKKDKSCINLLQILGPNNNMKWASGK